MFCSQFAIHLLINQRIQAVDGNTQKLCSVIIFIYFLIYQMFYAVYHMPDTVLHHFIF